MQPTRARGASNDRLPCAGSSIRVGAVHGRILCDVASTTVRSVSIDTHADSAMVKALARAFRWKRMLDDGRYASISEIADTEKIDRGYVGSILRLTLRAPDIIEAILNGRQTERLRRC